MQCAVSTLHYLVRVFPPAMPHILFIKITIIPTFIDRMSNQSLHAPSSIFIKWLPLFLVHNTEKHSKRTCSDKIRQDQKENLTLILQKTCICRLMSNSFSLSMIRWYYPTLQMMAYSHAFLLEQQAHSMMAYNHASLLEQPTRSIKFLGNHTVHWPLYILEGWMPRIEWMWKNIKYLCIWWLMGIMNNNSTLTGCLWNGRFLLYMGLWLLYTYLIVSITFWKLPKMIALHALHVIQ